MRSKTITPTIGPRPPAVKRFWRLAGLAAVLLVAQLMLVAHGFEAESAHKSAPDRDADGSAPVCVECLALCALQGAPPPAVALSMPPPGTLAASCAVPPAPTFARRMAFLSRAPPQLQS